ncbi:MAG: YXWGXW repeat-containing protein [candidate division KSB1 bacterium]|nr:YXWGXW repeat-containing protein [candidate division KSB1 bacterium]
MIAKRMLLIAAFGLALLLPRDGFSHNRIYVRIAPPKPKQVTVVTVRPHRHAVWVPGHWKWNGHRYVWVKGHWIKARKGYVYVPGRWKHTHHGWYWVPGRWKKA